MWQISFAVNINDAEGFGVDDDDNVTFDDFGGDDDDIDEVSNALLNGLVIR